MFDREVAKALGLDLGDGDLVLDSRLNCTSVRLMPIQVPSPLVVCLV